MQDNAASHKSKLVMDFLKNVNIQVFDWPPQSPNINPIEIVWAIIKAKC